MKQENNIQPIRVGVIGLGQRGPGLLEGVILKMEQVIVTAICDLYPDRMEAAAKMIQDKNGYIPACVADYHDVLNREDVDAVVIVSSWQEHVRMACDAMRAHKAVACEVGGACSIEECWDLVHTHEETQTPIMMLENCCYGRNELMLLNMVQLGVLGEIIHCRGGYCHDLRDEISFGRENRHYRLEHYCKRNCENYPTHEIGPIAKILNIGHGNRMLTLHSVASKSCGLNTYLQREKGEEYDLTKRAFAQGDVVTTVIKCANGETIQITLETTLPRPYSRQLEVHGTKGLYMEDNQSLFLDGIHNEFDFTWTDQWNNIEQLRDEYEHPIWKQYIKDGVQGGHDGMDWLALRDFFDCIRTGRPMPIDVYDMAAWMSITPLSEESIATGQTVSMPDFTGGRWMKEQKTMYPIE